MAGPSAPTLDQMEIYGSEIGCDVVFLAGQDEQWRLPAHKGVLQRVNPVFKAMFSSNFDNNGTSDKDQQGPKTIHVPDVDGRAFDNLLRYLYEEPVSLHSVDTALLTLCAAHKYQCAGLVQSSVDFLGANINTSNVLSILRIVRVLSGNLENVENYHREQLMNPSPLVKSDSANLNTIENSCAALLEKCLSFIDKKSNATIILESDEMEDLDIDSIQLILLRDELDIENELVVFQTILRWVDKECKRKQMPLTAESKRELLGESILLPRYLTMSVDTFKAENGPAQSGIFTGDEVQFLLRILRGAPHDKILPPANKGPCASEDSTHHCACMFGPHIQRLLTPRRPQQKIVTKSPAKKRKGSMSMVERWRARNNNNNRHGVCSYCCCKIKGGADSMTPSPTNSLQSSPVRSLGRRRGSDKSTRRMDMAVNHFFMCLAYFFD